MVLGDYYHKGDVIMGIISDVHDRDKRIEMGKARDARLSEVAQEDKRLDALHGKKRPKCEICGGQLGLNQVIKRCPCCGHLNGAAHG